VRLLLEKKGTAWSELSGVDHYEGLSAGEPQPNWDDSRKGVKGAKGKRNLYLAFLASWRDEKIKCPVLQKIQTVKKFAQASKRDPSWWRALCEPAR
jgi:hypothetical protein